MKVRLLIGLSVVLVIVALAFSAKTFRVTAQNKGNFTPPPQAPTLLPSPSQIAPASPQTPTPTTATTSASLPELIANLKALRKQEQQLTAAIKDKIKAQKMSLSDAENELKTLGIDMNDNNDKGDEKKEKGEK